MTAGESTVLVVDDEREIADLIAWYLDNEGYHVISCHSGADALELIRERDFDLAILDVMLPDVNGFKLCREIRKAHAYPVIMLTARDEEVDKITGLNFGADDYMTKPFTPLELVARVKAQLRRYRQYNAVAGNGGARDVVPQGDELTVKGLVLRVKTHECALNGKPIQLTPTEFTILRVLMEHNGEVVSSSDLYEQLYGTEDTGKASSAISVHIRHLRGKLGDSFDKPQYIATVWAVGYRIIV